MREATKLGVIEETQKHPRENITEDEEAIFWKQQLLGKISAESCSYYVFL